MHGACSLSLTVFRRRGELVKEVAYLPLAEDIPITFNSCRKGPRGIDWRSDRDAEFSWIEAQVNLCHGSCTAP